MGLLLHEIAAHMTTTPPAALAPLLWGAGLMLLLRRVRCGARVDQRPAAAVVTPVADLRSAA